MDRTEVFAALDLSFEVLSDDLRILACLRAAYSGCASGMASAEHRYVAARTGSGRQPGYGLWMDGRLVGIAASAPALVQGLLGHITRQVVAGSGRHLLLHAASLCRDGHGLVLPAAHASGKSTLAAGLVHSGWDYMSDEITAVDFATLRILGCPKPLSIRGRSKGILAALGLRMPKAIEVFTRRDHEWQIPPLEVRSGCIAAVCQPRFLIFPKYRPQPSTEAVALSKADALQMLLAHTFNFCDHGQNGLRLLGDLVQACSCYSLTVSKLRDACSVIAQLTGSANACCSPGAGRRCAGLN